MAESLKNKTVKGTLWSLLERFSVQGIMFIVMIIMARILTPEDYGLVAELTIFIAVAQSLVDSGFSQALIRKQDRSPIDNSTVFFFNIVIGFALYGLFFISAPAIANFYGQPELIPLTRVIALSLVINSLVVVQRALLTVAIDFKTQAKASLTAAIISGVIGIIMAYTGFGYWSIVWFQLANYGVSMVMLWILSNWRPTLEYSWKSFRELFSFGSKLALSGIINTVYNNVYLIVIGKIFKASDLGFYTRAHQFSDFPSSNLTNIIQRVTYPVLCSIQDEDERLRYIYRRFLKMSAFVIFPLMLGLSAIAHPLVLVLLKSQWEFTAVLLQIICFAMMNYLRLFYDSENVALTDYGVFLFVEFDLGAGILAGYDSVADLDVHLNFLAVNESAGTYGNYLGNLGLLLCGSGEDNAAARSFFNLDRLDNNSVCKRFDFHIDSS